LVLLQLRWPLSALIDLQWVRTPGALRASAPSLQAWDWEVSAQAPWLWAMLECSTVGRCVHVGPTQGAASAH